MNVMRRGLWAQALRSNDEGADAILTKFADGDTDALLSMAELPRLGEIVRTVWVKRAKGGIIDVKDKRPSDEAYAYRPELMFNYGVKLGGAKAFCRPGDTDCIDLYKGQNIFPQGLLGGPLGRWSPTARRESTRYIYSYHEHIGYEQTYAFRKISQLPTAVNMEGSYGFQDTALVCDLSEDFPLNSYLMSRLVQFYAARVLRSSIIEDFGCTWSKRTLIMLPIPPDRTPERLKTLQEKGQDVMDADSNIADRYREIDALIAVGEVSGRTVNRLIVEGDSLVTGINLNGVSEKPVPVAHIREAGDEVNTSDLFFRLVVPNGDLRTFIAFQLARRIEENPDAELARDDVLALAVPTNLDEVTKNIRSLTTDDLEGSYLEALAELDRVVAEQCGIPDDLRDHMIAAMTKDPILSQMRPMIAQRGLRVQPYADHSEGDRYA